MKYLATGCWIAVEILILVSFGTPAISSAAPPADLAFKGYNHARWWRSIYLGRFDLVRPAKCDLPARFCEADTPDDIDIAIQILKNAPMLRIAFVEYHRSWEKICKDGSSERTVAAAQWKKTRNGVVVETFDTQVRPRFKEAFDDFYHPMAESTRELKMDLDRLLVDQKCGSEVLTQFEDNLHRALLRRDSVQAERSGMEKTPLFSAGCRQVLADIKATTPAEAACPCVYKSLVGSLSGADVFRLEDNFTREKFLWTSVAEVGLKDKVAACLR